MHKTLVEKYNAAVVELNTRIDKGESLNSIERIFGFLLGVVSCMELLKDEKANHARANLLPLYGNVRITREQFKNNRINTIIQ